MKFYTSPPPKKKKILANPLLPARLLSSRPSLPPWRSFVVPRGGGGGAVSGCVQAKLNYTYEWPASFSQSTRRYSITIGPSLQRKISRSAGNHCRPIGATTTQRLALLWCTQDDDLRTGSIQRNAALTRSVFQSGPKKKNATLYLGYTPVRYSAFGVNRPYM